MRRHFLMLATCFILVTVSTCCLAQANVEQSVSSSSAPALTNSDIVGMTRAGLSADVIVAKIKKSICSFDTSPAALKQLKVDEVPEVVILAMVESPNQTRATAKEETTPAPGSRTPGSESRSTPPEKTEPVKPSGHAGQVEAASLPKGYQISYVKSDRKWKLGLRSEPYDKISEYVQADLVEALEGKGIRTVDLPPENWTS